MRVVRVVGSWVTWLRYNCGVEIILGRIVIIEEWSIISIIYSSELFW